MHLLGQQKLILLLLLKNVHVYAFHHIILALYLLCILIPYYVHVHAYRITRRSHSTRIQSRGAGGPAEDPAVGGYRRRRTGAGGTFRVPRS
jgi:hypothetical protein